MPPDAPRGPNIRELESLRIARSAEPKKPSRIIPAAVTVIILGVIGVAGWLVYQRTLGRPPEVQTATVMLKQAGQAGTVLPRRGDPAPQQKYIVIGTQILGQIFARPIQEDAPVKPRTFPPRIHVSASHSP